MVHNQQNSAGSTVGSMGLFSHDECPELDSHTDSGAAS